MKKNSVKKLSLLGLVLIAASAVTAAVLPSKNDDSNNFQELGTHTNDSDSAGLIGGAEGLTCTDDDGTLNPSCTQTAESATTVTGDNQSDLGTDTASGQTSA